MINSYIWGGLLLDWESECVSGRDRLWEGQGFSFSLLQSGKEESPISFHPEGGLHACAPILHAYFAWNQGNCVYLLFSLLSVYAKGKKQPFHHHSSLSRHAQVRHNRRQKDVPAQVWQAAANTNVMFFKLYINKSWQNYSEQIPTSFRQENYKLLQASQVTTNPFYFFLYKYPSRSVKSVHTSLMILFTHLKRWQANWCYHLCQRTGIILQQCWIKCQ